MTASDNQANETPLHKRVLRLVASALVAVAISGLALLLCNILFEAMAFQQKFGLDDDVSFITLLLGPLCLAFFHSTLHSTRWASRTCVALGVLTLVGSALVYFSASEAAANHVPTGPFSGLGTAMAALLAMYCSVLGLCCALGGWLAGVSR